MSYRVIIIDLFHAHDPDETWETGSYDTLDEAIAVAKHKIDREIDGAFEEERRAGAVTAERVLTRFFDFGGLPLVVTSDHRAAFDSRAYATKRARKLTTE